MDVSVLVSFLAPLLPYLVKAGEKTAETVAARFGEGVWERAQSLWQRLRPRIDDRPSAREAVADVAGAPDNDDARAALRLQLTKVLAEDPALAEAVEGLMEQARERGELRRVVAVGERSVAVGGDVSDSTIHTGDRFTE